MSGQPLTPVPGESPAREQDAPDGGTLRPLIGGTTSPGNLNSTQVTDTGATAVPAEAVPPEVLSAPPSARLGRFIRVSLLGSGGMGEVYKSWDPNLRRWVALKVLRPGNEDVAPWFQREARLAAQLHHPGLVGIHEIGQEEGKLYIAMQFVEGRTLDRMSGESRALLVTLLRDASAAIGYAHEQGIVHRDLKPENLIVESKLLPGEAGAEPRWEHRVCILDFGVARALGSLRLTAMQMAVGTPLYMSPEQARGEAPQPPGDVYSLGATLYECLVGAPPIRGESMNATIQLLQTRQPVPLRAIDPSISPELAGVVHKCLAKDPRDRYVNGMALAEDLTRYLEGKPVTAATTSRLNIVLRRVMRRWKVYAAAAAALLIVAAVTTGATLAIVHANAAAARGARALALQKRVAQQRFAAYEALASGDAAAARSALEAGEAACREELGRGDFAEGHFFLGELARARGAAETAEAEYGNALSSNPTLVDAHIGRALARASRREALTKQIVARMGGAPFMPGPPSQMTQVELERGFPELNQLRIGIQQDLASIPGEAQLLPDTDLDLARSLHLEIEGSAAGREPLQRTLGSSRPLPEIIVAACDLDLRSPESRGEAAFALATQGAKAWPGSANVRLARSRAAILAAPFLADAGARAERLRIGLSEAAEAARLGSAGTEAWQCQGIAAFSLGDYPAAESAFTLVLEADSSDIVTLLRRAEVRIQAGRNPAAVEDLKEALRRLPAESTLRTALPRKIEVLTRE